MHVETLAKAARAAGGEVDVLDIGKGQVPAEHVHPAGGYANFAAKLASFAARGYLIHLHTSGANPKSWLLGAACVAAGRASGKAPMLTLHSGLGPAWLAESAARRTVAGGVLRGFGTVVAVSDPIAKAVMRCGFPEQRLVVVPAFSTSFLVPGELPHHAARVRADAAPLLVAMLAQGRIYGEVELLTAFAAVHAERPRAHLIVFGPGTKPHELGPRAEKLAGRTAALNIHGLGEIGRPSALAVMAAADLFLRPTHADGDSVSVREALALGRKVVCTTVGTRPPGVLLVPPGDAVALARGIALALDSPASETQLPVAQDSDLLRTLLPRYGLVAPEAKAVRAA